MTHNLKWIKITHICLICEVIFAFFMFKHQFYSKYQWFVQLIKRNKNDSSRLIVDIVVLSGSRAQAMFNPLIAKLFNCNFHPLKVVSR